MMKWEVQAMAHSIRSEMKWKRTSIVSMEKPIIYNVMLLFSQRGLLKKSVIFLFPTGIKVIGGVKEVTGEEFGVYVKRILPGGLASNNGEHGLVSGYIFSFTQDYFFY